MEKRKEIAAILNEVINLLAPYDENWTNSLKRLKKEMDTSPEEAMRHLKNLYGGMGSFNDLVLQKNGQMPKEENHKLFNLRSKLYELCY